MEYQVWTKDEYQELWTKVDCGDMPAAEREVMAAIIAGRDPLLTQKIPYVITLVVQEERKGEAEKSKTKSGKGAGDEGDVKVHPGGDGDIPTVGETGRGDSADNTVSGK